MSQVEYDAVNGDQSERRKTRQAMLLRLAYTLGFGVLAWALLCSPSR